MRAIESEQRVITTWPLQKQYSCSSRRVAPSFLLWGNGLTWTLESLSRKSTSPSAASKQAWECPVPHRWRIRSPTFFWGFKNTLPCPKNVPKPGVSIPGPQALRGLFCKHSHSCFLATQKSWSKATRGVIIRTLRVKILIIWSLREVYQLLL